MGFGVGLGVPAILGVSFAIGFGKPLLLVLPIPFALLLLIAWRYRVTGYRVCPDAIAILRPSGESPIPMAEVAETRFPAARPEGATFGLLRVEGIFGSQGLYWNRNWGRFRVYVTDDRHLVEIVLLSGRRVLVSPDDPAGFAAAVAQARGE